MKLLGLLAVDDDVHGTQRGGPQASRIPQRGDRVRLEVVHENDDHTAAVVRRFFHASLRAPDAFPGNVTRVMAGSAWHAQPTLPCCYVAVSNLSSPG